MKWSPQQDKALKAVDKWFYTESKKKQVFYLAGYAGTGKTTLAKHFAELIDGDISYGAFTGKAALVMRKNGCIGARTIHSLMYIAEQDPVSGEVTFKLNRAQSPLNDASLVIIDECSMVDESIAKDLLSFHKPILVLGDPAQLPPPTGAGYFTQREPDFMLTEIHRQASENPILYLATQLRQGIYPDEGEYGESRIVTKVKSTDLLEVDQVLAGRNVTRHDMNAKMRKLLNRTEVFPMPKEKLICLQNDKDIGIFNGGMFTHLQTLTPKFKTKFLHMMLESDDEERAPVPVKIHQALFDDSIPMPDWKTLKGSQSFDYGYCLTTHKSQGSQWETGLIYDESYCFRDDKFKWLYTAVTRFSDKLTLVRN